MWERGGEGAGARMERGGVLAAGVPVGGEGERGGLAAGAPVGTAVRQPARRRSSDNEGDGENIPSPCSTPGNMMQRQPGGCHGMSP